VSLDDPRLKAATIYSSLEPCSIRKSRPCTCTQWILAAGIPRVVYAMREPETFVIGAGAAALTEAGVTVVQRADLIDEAKQVSPLYS
jgi:pyrimidine deaminase RibD-like protein